MGVYSHESPLRAGKPNRNGAYWYSVEICKNIIPNVETDRPWVTIKLGDFCVDHAIYFIHDNLTPQRYEFLRKYKDIVAVCGLEETCGKVCAYCGKHVVFHTQTAPLSTFTHRGESLS